MRRLGVFAHLLSEHGELALHALSEKILSKTLLEEVLCQLRDFDHLVAFFAADQHRAVFPEVEVELVVRSKRWVEGLAEVAGC